MTSSANVSKTLQTRIVSGTLVLLSGSGLTAGINLAYNVAIARFLGPNGFGQATAVYTLLTLISAVTLSYQLIAAKAVARQNAAHEGQADYRAFGLSAWGAGLIIALVLLLFRNQITAYLHLSDSILVVLLGVGSVFYVPLGNRRGLVLGAYGFRRLAANLVVEGVARLGGSLLMVGFGLGIEGVVAANAAAIAIAYFATTPPRTVPETRPLRLGYIHREVGQAMIFFCGQILINNCDIVLVKHFFTPTAAGLYAVVAIVGRVIFALCQAVVNSMVPTVAGTRDEERRNFSLLRTALLLVLTIGSVLAVALRFTTPGLWTKLFGASFLLTGPYGFPYLLALYAVMTVVYSLSAVTITYEMSYKIANTSWVQLVFSFLFIAGIYEYHSSLQQVIVVQLVLASIMLAVVAVPFLHGAITERKARRGSGADPVHLVRCVSEDEVIAEFLKSDFNQGVYGSYREQFHNLVYTPDFDSKDESAKRRALLSVRHLALWKELPADTVWYEITLQPSDLYRIRVFPRAQWRKIARGNFAISEVAEQIRSRKPNLDDPLLLKLDSIRRRFAQGESDLGSAVLIGLNAAEPMAIIDGNHRFVAAVLEGCTHQLRFFCGFSPKMNQCCWYRTNLRTLSRYGGNLLRQLRRDPRAELASLFEIPLTDGPSPTRMPSGTCNTNEC